MTTLREAGEQGLLARLLPRLAPRGADLLVAAGEDDAAAWREADGSITVAKIDAFVEGVHFDPAWMSAGDAGWRAIALTVSDLAAKGAAPLYGLVSLSARPDTSLEAVEDLYDGMSEAAAACGLRLVGGDTTRTSGPITIAVAVTGRAPGVFHPRSEARPGMLLGVTGPLGGAALALAERRATRPRPRLEEGRALALAGAAAGDISDGLLRELLRFAEMAGVGVRVEEADVPIAPGATLAQALESGEEVELLAAGEPRSLAGCTVIGAVTDTGRVVLAGAGAEREVTAGGYDHFA